MRTLKQVFVLLHRTGLRLNMGKTDWVKTEVKFLGHLITDQGVTVPPEFSQITKAFTKDFERSPIFSWQMQLLSK